MDIDFDTSGFQTMIDSLDNLGKAGEKIFKEALDEGAKVIHVKMQDKVYQVLRRKTGALQDNIKIGKVRKGKDGVWSQVIGPGKGDISEAFYGKFSEYGSSHEKAKPWMRPAFDESAGEAYRKIETIIQDGMERSFK